MVYRSIVRQARKRIRFPNLDHLWPKLDQRVVNITPAESATAFPLWLRIATLQRGHRINLPLAQNAWFQQQLAKADGLAKTIQLIPRHELGQQQKRFDIAVYTNQPRAFRSEREAYQALMKTDAKLGGEISLDFVMCVFLSDNEGDLLGRRWYHQIEKYDRKITALAAYRQSCGLPVSSPRYRRYVRQLRGFLKTEIRRILYRLVARRVPAKLILEKLNFSSPHLSRRMNRLLGLCGRGILVTALDDLVERKGIEVEFREAAYSSQECRKCHYIDRRNRKNQARFECLFCHKKCHADVNAAGTLLSRGQAVKVSTKASRRRVLTERCKAFNQRYLLSWYGQGHRRFGTSVP